jgi:hypothetical protein
MKKILSIVLGVFLCAQAFAQVSVNAGYLNTAYRSGESGYSYKVNGNGFYVGASYDLKSTNYPQFSFAPGLNFNLADYNFSEGVNTIEYFLSAPLHIRYTQPVSNVADVFVSAGPTLVCTLGSKTKVSYGGASYSENEKGGDFDVPIGIEGGVLLSNNIKLMVGYDFGLVNQSGDSDYRVTRNIFHVGLGYIF